MRSYATSLVACSAVLALAGTGLGQTTCWDNDMEVNGINGRATSPPAFPDIRVVDDFTVPQGDPWLVCDYHKVNVEDATWVPVLPVEVFIYNDEGGCPGTLKSIKQTDRVIREFKGFQLFGRDVYNYWIEFPCQEYPPGMYHIGSRWPAGGGSGTTYWLTSNGGMGTDKTGCFSLDAGATWMDQGPDWHMAFIVTGFCGPPPCEPCKGDLNEDCVVGFQDLLQMLAAWGPCDPQGNCPNPGDCAKGKVPRCENLPECHCFSTPGPRGGVLGWCGTNFPCAGIEPCGQPGNVCPAGFVCLLRTCCPQGEGTVCVPVEEKCVGGAAPSPPAAPGTWGIGGMIE